MAMANSSRAPSRQPSVGPRPPSVDPRPQTPIERSSGAPYVSSPSRRIYARQVEGSRRPSAQSDLGFLEMEGVLSLPPPPSEMDDNYADEMIASLSSFKPINGSLPATSARQSTAA